jgi:hypothetical protein
MRTIPLSIVGFLLIAGLGSVRAEEWKGDNPTLYDAGKAVYDSLYAGNPKAKYIAPESIRISLVDEEIKKDPSAAAGKLSFGEKSSYNFYMRHTYIAYFRPELVEAGDAATAEGFYATLHELDIRHRDYLKKFIEPYGKFEGPNAAQKFRDAQNTVDAVSREREIANQNAEKYQRWGSTFGAAYSCVCIVAFFIALGVLNILLLIWVARDAKNRGMDNAVVWMLLVLVASVLGLIIYMSSRPTGALVKCSHCGNKRLQVAALCPHCGKP